MSDWIFAGIYVVLGLVVGAAVFLLVWTSHLDTQARIAAGGPQSWSCLSSDGRQATLP